MSLGLLDQCLSEFDREMGVDPTRAAARAGRSAVVADRIRGR